MVFASHASRSAAALLLLLLASSLDAEQPSPRGVAGKSLSAWTDALKNGDELARLQAVRTLPELGQLAAAPLRDALDDPSPAVRYATAEALGNLRLLAEDGRSKKLLDDEHIAVRTAAAYALLRHGPQDRAFSLLIDALEYNNRTLPLAAIDFLEKLGLEGDLSQTQREQALAALRRHTGDKDSHITKAATRAIRNLERDAQPHAKSE